MFTAIFTHLDLGSGGSNRIANISAAFAKYISGEERRFSRRESLGEFLREIGGALHSRLEISLDD